MPQIPLIGAPGPLQIPFLDSPLREARYADNAVGQLAGTIAKGADDQVRQADAVAKQQQAAEAQVSIINAASAAHVKALQGFQDAVNSGQAAGATDATLKQFDQDAQDGLTGIPQQYQAHYQANMAQLRGQLAVSLGEREMGARNLQLGADTAAGVDSDARLAMVDPSQAGELIAQRRASIDLLPIPPAERAKLATEATQRTAYAAASTIADSKPQSFLDSLTPDGVQKDPILSSLAPANLEALRNHATALVQQQANAQQRAADAADKLGNDTYNGLTDFVNQGRTPDLNYMAEVRQNTAGTKWAAPAESLLQLSAKTAGFGSQSLPQQQQTIAQVESQLSKGSNPDEDKMLGSLRTIAGNQQAAFKDDPLGAYTRFARGPAMPPQQIGSVDQAMQVIGSRMSTLPGVEAYGGVQGVSPLHPEEAQQLAGTLRGLPPDQAATALAGLGTAVGSPQRIAALAKQLDDKDGTLGEAMAYAGQQTTSGRLTSEYILRGDLAMKDKTAQIDETKVSGWRATIAARIRDAYGNTELEDRAIDSAVKITAGRESMGIAAGDTDAGIRLATNGIIDHGAGKTVLPAGMNEDQFNSKLGSITAAQLQPQAPDSMLVAGRQMIPLATFVQHLPQATLQVMGGGRYAVKAGNSIITNTAGQPVVLTLK